MAQAEKTGMSGSKSNNSYSDQKTISAHRPSLMLFDFRSFKKSGLSKLLLTHLTTFPHRAPPRGRCTSAGPVYICVTYTVVGPWSAVSVLRAGKITEVEDGESILTGYQKSVKPNHLFKHEADKPSLTGAENTLKETVN